MCVEVVASLQITSQPASQCGEIAEGEAGPVCLFKTSDDSLRALMSSDFLCRDWLFLPAGGP